MPEEKTNTESTEDQRAGPDQEQEASDGTAEVDDAGPAVHPAANLFPLMADDEIKALGDDIKANGQQEPIIRWKGHDVIVDGRNRLAACKLAGVEPTFKDVEFEDDEAVTRYIISANIHRRHLTPSQIAMVAARMVTTDASGGRPEKTGPIGPVSVSRQNAAVITGASEKSITRARKVLEKGDAALIEKVDRGDVTVTKAIKQIEGKKPKKSKKPSPPKEQEEPSSTDDAARRPDGEDAVADARANDGTSDSEQPATDPQTEPPAAEEPVQAHASGLPVAYINYTTALIKALYSAAEAGEPWPKSTMDDLGGEERLRAALASLKSSQIADSTTNDNSA